MMKRRQPRVVRPQAVRDRATVAPRPPVVALQVHAGPVDRVAVVA